MKKTKQETQAGVARLGSKIKEEKENA